jgi:predicted MFS family arabinose efflux permease
LSAVVACELRVLTAVAAITLVMVPLTGSGWGMVIAIWARWLVGFGFPAPLRARVLKDAAGTQTLASTLTTTSSNVGTAAAAVGAATIASGWGYCSLLLISVAATIIALMGILILRARDLRRKPAPA